MYVFMYVRMYGPALHSNFGSWIHFVVSAEARRLPHWFRTMLFRTGFALSDWFRTTSTFDNNMTKKERRVSGFALVDFDFKQELSCTFHTDLHPLFCDRSKLEKRYFEKLGKLVGMLQSRTYKLEFEAEGGVTLNAHNTPLCYATFTRLRKVVAANFLERCK